MNNPPAFQFYPKDFLSDEKVISMTMEERGVYTTMLCMCWIEDGLEIGSRVVEGWFNQYPSVARCFYEKDGKFRNKRLDEERRKQVLWHDKSVKGGRKSAETRRLRKGGSTKGQPKVNQRSTLPSSSSSSSSIIPLSIGVELPGIPKNFAFKVQDRLRELKAAIMADERLLKNEKAMTRKQITADELRERIGRDAKAYISMIEDRQ